MTAVEQNELKGLRIHEASFVKSIEAMEANPAHSPRVLNNEKRGLAAIRARIDVIDPPPPPAPAPVAEAVKPEVPKPLFKKK